MQALPRSEQSLFHLQRTPGHLPGRSDVCIAICAPAYLGWIHCFESARVRPAPIAGQAIATARSEIRTRCAVVSYACFWRASTCRTRVPLRRRQEVGAAPELPIDPVQTQWRLSRQNGIRFTTVVVRYVKEGGSSGCGCDWFASSPVAQLFSLVE